MNKHDWDLEYPFNEKQDTNALADIIEACAAGGITKEQLITWFENHKRVLED